MHQSCYMSTSRPVYREYPRRWSTSEHGADRHDIARHLRSVGMVHVHPEAAFRFNHADESHLPFISNWPAIRWNLCSLLQTHMPTSCRPRMKADTGLGVSPATLPRFAYLSVGEAPWVLTGPHRHHHPYKPRPPLSPSPWILPPDS